MPDPNNHFHRIPYGDSQPARPLLGKLRHLPDFKPALLPINFRRDEQIDKETVAVVEINAVAVFGVILHSRPHAAPEGFEWRTECFEVSGLEREEINHHARVRIL